MLDVGVSEIAAICRDTDGNGVCNADEPCTGGVALVKAELQLKKLDTPVGDDGLAFSGQMTVPPARRSTRDEGRATGGGRRERHDHRREHPARLVDPATKDRLEAEQVRDILQVREQGGSGRDHERVRPDEAETPGSSPSKDGQEQARSRPPGATPLRATLSLDASGQCGQVDFTGPSPICAFNKLSTVTCK